jgi:hypothetical protein
MQNYTFSPKKATSEANKIFRRYNTKKNVFLRHRKNGKMKRYRTSLACFLLAVYLPVWLLSSFHVHVQESIDYNVECEHHSSEMDEDGCLLCQFQQLVYEEAPQLYVTFNRPEPKVVANPFYCANISASEYVLSLRAPPVLL